MTQENTDTLAERPGRSSEPKGEQNVSEANTLELVKYELMLIFFPDLGEEAINKEIEELAKHLAADSGEIFHKDIWGLRNLAYKIKKQSEGYYVVLNFTLPPTKISELEKSLTIDPAVIRFLITKIPLNYEVKTLAEYETIAKEEEKKEQEAKKEQEEAKKQQVKKFKTAKVVKEEPKKAPVKKVEEAVEPEPKEAEVKKPAKKAAAKDKLEELDQKLKNIIDDPDISL